MVFLGISLIISAAIIAATAFALFNKSVQLYKETYSSLFTEDRNDPVETLEEPEDIEIKFGEF